MNCHLITTRTLNSRLTASLHAEDYIILLADGCYVSLNDDVLTSLTCEKVLILKDDAIARGLVVSSQTTKEHVDPIEYSDLVDLTLNCEKVITWK